MGKILRRCDLCKHWGAEYRVPQPDGSILNLCYRCWKNTQLAPQKDSVKDQSKPDHELRAPPPNP